MDNDKIISWCKDLEEGPLKQAQNLASLPFLYKYVCLMPDAHQGYGMPIGGVIATKGVLIPNAVGVDIGCGVIAAKTNIKNISLDKIKSIMGIIRKKIPVGFNHHKEAQPWEGFDVAPNILLIQSQLKSAAHQLGTLGGGNHFIELQRDEEGFLWLMIHSGSRNFGYKIAHHYNKVAQDLCKKWYSNIPPIKGEDGLAFLPIDSKEGQEYYEAMNFAASFGRASRRKMLQKGLLAFHEIIGDFEVDDETINIPHNYASLENHFGENVWVHRKGATSAKKDELGIIPGSQGTSSYIVKGKGNPKSFMSCSHGAGRAMSRKRAREELNLKEQQNILNEKNIVHSIRTQKDLDEASSAYKDIDQVMKQQEDLIEIVHKLSPLGVIKGEIR